jgi:hypothetical protein
VRVATLLCILAALPATAATSLFPRPLHLVRRIDGPAAKSESVDEYCSGNRIVTVRGKRVLIADYAEQQLTEIDRDASTYSVTRFDEIAKAAAQLSASRPAAASRFAVTRVETMGSRDRYRIEGANAKIEVGIDRSIALSRDAVEALLGAAYPNVRRPEHEAVLQAAGGGVGGGRVAAQSAEPQYGLPAEETITYSFEGSSVTLHSAIVRADVDAVPPELLLIPPGARRVESRITRIGRELQDVETLPGRKP